MKNGLRAFVVGTNFVAVPLVVGSYVEFHDYFATDDDYWVQTRTGLPQTI